MSILSVFGFVGATCILIAFLQASRGAWSGTSWRFQLFNLVGSAILALYSLLLGAHALVALNIVWFFVACVGLWRSFARRT